MLWKDTEGHISCKITRTGYCKLRPHTPHWTSLIILSYFPSLWRISFHYILCWTTGGSLRKSETKSQPGHTKSIDNHSASWTWNKRAPCFGQKKTRTFLSIFIFFFFFTKAELGSVQDYVTAGHELWWLCVAWKPEDM